MLKLRLIALTLLAFLVIGCSNSVQTMLEDYNSNFTVTHEVDDYVPPSPGDPDFVEDEMLYRIYYVSDEDVLNLYAPFNCDRYEWVVIDPELYVAPGFSPIKIELKMYNGADAASREFIAYIPESIDEKIIETGHTYKLTLNVWKRGVKYSCTTQLVIYKHYEF